MHKTQWKKLFCVSFALIILLTASLSYVLAQSGTTFTISSGIYPHAPSYTFWCEGSTYYGKDAYGVLTSGTNAITVINNAINAVDEGLFFFKAGIYALASPILVYYSDNNRNLELRGEGEATVLYSTETQPLATDVYVIRLRGASKTNSVQNITISNMKILGNEVNHHPIHIYYGKFVTISNVNIDDGEEGITILESDYVTVENSLIENTETAGVEISTNSHYNTIKNNYFLNDNKNETAEPSGALKVWWGTGQIACTYNKLIGNFIEGGGFQGIRLVGAYYTLVEGNTLKDIDDDGIWEGGATKKNIYSNNLIYNTGAEGIELQGFNNIVTGNIIYNSATVAIWSGGWMNQISNNRIRLTQGSSQGIYIWETNRTIVSNNLISHTGSTDAIYLLNVTYSIIEGNICQAKAIVEAGSSVDYNLIHGNIVSSITVVGANTNSTDNITGA